MFGKVPPIVGGVSVQTFETALDLARAGHDIDIISNRMDGRIGRERAVEVSSLEVPENVRILDIASMQGFSHIPFSPAFLERMLGLAARWHGSQHYSLAVGWYFLPYSVAAYLFSKINNIPFILAHAGSDLGRLSLHGDLRVLFGKMLRDAAAVLTPDRDITKEKLISLGVDADRLVYIRKGTPLPSYYSAPKTVDRSFCERVAYGQWRETVSDCDNLHPIYSHASSLGRDLEVLCFYGKVSISKQLDVLLEAVNSVAKWQTKFTLLLIVSGEDAELSNLDSIIGRCTNLAGRLTVMPPVMPWAIPEILRGCKAVFYLEKGFLVDVHLSKVPREAIRCGAVPVVSADIGKLPFYRDVLIDGVNSIVVNGKPQLERRLHRLLEDSQYASVLRNGALTTSKYVEAVIGDVNPYSAAIGQLADQLASLQ